MKTVMQNTHKNADDKDIIFVQLPPAISFFPSPAFSILKSFLKNQNIKVGINYFNIQQDIEFEILKEYQTTNTEALLPYIKILNHLIFKDDKKSKLTDVYFQCLFPQLFLREKSYHNELINDITTKLLQIIDESIDCILSQNPKIIGFSSKFGQWIPAIIFAHRIKQRASNVSIVIGGITNSAAAKNILKIVPYFDYCIWGEGEIPLYRLYNHITNLVPVTKIPRIAYRKENIVLTTKNEKNSFTNLNNTLPDFSDYFNAKNFTKDRTQIAIPLERSRGCHWNKCKFCYLSQGYSYRKKENNSLISEIKHISKEHKFYKFIFVDNDLAGEDIAEFNKLLDELILFKEEHSEFEIKMAEIVTKNLNATTIKKMALAGITSVQIGVESISDSLLAKINKKQSVADNLFFIREAYKNNIIIKGANIIVDTLDETDNDIMESINTLEFLRFFLSDKKLELNVIPLAVSNFSRYLKIIRKNNSEHEWNVDDLFQIVPNDFVNKIDRFSLFEFAKNTIQIPLWSLFEKASNYYNENKYRYQLTKCASSNTQIYREYVNDELVKELEFDREIYTFIINTLQEKVWAFKELYNEISLSYKVSDEELKFILQELNSEALIYYNKNLTQITSVIYLN